MGARLVLCDVDAAGLAGTARACTGAAVLAGDVGEEATHRDLVALALQRFGQLDMALNNAGVAHRLDKLHDIAVADAERRRSNGEMSACQIAASDCGATTSGKRSGGGLRQQWALHQPPSSTEPSCGWSKAYQST